MRRRLISQRQHWTRSSGSAPGSGRRARRETNEIEAAAGGGCLRAGGADQHGVGLVERGEQLLQIGDLRQVVIDDVRIARVLSEKILVIVLGAIECLSRLNR